MNSQNQVSLVPLVKHTYPEWGFRPGTICYPMEMNFIFVNGGMGDYITWMTPIRWLASQATWIRGTLVVPNYFIELAQYWLRDYPEWKVQTYRELKELPNADTAPFRGPMNLQNEALNATGAHLSTCGWVYFVNKEGPPPGWEHYSQFRPVDLAKVELPELPERYAVLTTGITTNSRKIPGHYWNPIIEHLRERGLTPVFLGKSEIETGNAKNIRTQYSPEVRFDLGLDLRNKTSLMQAAAVLRGAAVVIGHDNGLLHLAGCTDVPIVFGYNLASPQHREPSRPHGRTYNVALTHEELACNFCQSNTNFLIGYNFRECFYSDLKCIHMLFENGGQRWKSAIDQALAEAPAVGRTA